MLCKDALRHPDHELIVAAAARVFPSAAITASRAVAQAIGSVRVEPGDEDSAGKVDVIAGRWAWEHLIKQVLGDLELARLDYACAAT